MESPVVSEAIPMAVESLFKFGAPTIERPFGIALWPIFDKAWTAVMGYSANDFRFEAGVTPMSTLKETGIFVVLYYILILGGREVMRNREPLKLRAAFLIHNFYLTAISGILLVLFIEQIVPELYYNGVFHAICDRSGGWTQPLVVLYYVSRIHAAPVPPRERLEIGGQTC
jgi:fatty acid elongase 3